MARVNYPSSSPYAATPQANWFIGNYVHRSIPSNDGDKPFTITTKYLNRPDLLACDLYGNPGYWWVFSARNPNTIRDAIWDFEVGKVIIIPSQNHLKATLG